MTQPEKENTMRAYHNDQAVKDKYVNRMKKHIHLDEVVAGQTGAEGKGCAVYCTLDKYNHARFPIELGIPQWLAYVYDTVYEGVSDDKKVTFALNFLEAPNIGADLESIKPKFLIMVLKSALEIFDHKEFPEIKAAIDGSIALWERDDIGSQEFIDAAARAADAASYAACAANASYAARAARAADASYAAIDAACAADAASYAARAADASYAAIYAACAVDAAVDVTDEADEADEAADAAKYDYFAGELIKMIQGAKWPTLNLALFVV